MQRPLCSKTGGRLGGILAYHKVFSISSNCNQMGTHLHLCLIHMLPLVLVSISWSTGFSGLDAAFTHSISRCPILPIQAGVGKSNGRLEGGYIDFSVWLRDILAKNSSLGQCSSTETTFNTVHWLLLTSPASGFYCYNKVFWILSVPRCLWCLLVCPDAPSFWKKPLDERWLLIPQPVFFSILPSSRSLHQQAVSGTANGHKGAFETESSREFYGPSCSKQSINRAQVNLYQQHLSLWGPWHPAVLSTALVKHVLPGDPSAAGTSQGKQSCSPASQGAVLLCAFIHVHTHHHPSLKAENPARIQTKPFCCFQYAKSVPFSQLQDCVS